MYFYYITVFLISLIILDEKVNQVLTVNKKVLETMLWLEKQFIAIRSVGISNPQDAAVNLKHEFPITKYEYLLEFMEDIKNLNYQGLIVCFLLNISNYF